MASTTPIVLSLDTLVSGLTVQINGEPYELLTLPRMPWADGRRYDRYWRRIRELMETATEPTDAELAELDALPDLMCRLVLMAPPDVHAGLDNHQRMRILDAFSSTPPPARGEEPRQAPGLSTTETPSPASAGSTAAIQ